MLALAGGAFSGMALRPPRGRDILPYVAGVCGVGSLLLYEAWLAGIPVLSAQFGLKRVGMRRLADLDGVHYHVGAPAFEKSCAAWLEQCRAGRAAVRPELGMHAESAARAADMVQALMAGK